MEGGREGGEEEKEGGSGRREGGRKGREGRREEGEGGKEGGGEYSMFVQGDLKESISKHQGLTLNLK